MSRQLMEGCLAWLWREQRLSLVLGIAFVMTAVGVVYSSHMTRALYSELQTLQREADDLDSDYERLLLEQSAWANYTRIDQLAREELSMEPPAADSIVVVADVTEVSP